MKVSSLAKRMITAISIVAAICVAGSIIYHRSLEFLPFLVGTLIGTAVSILKVFLLERTVDRALAMEKSTATKYVTLQGMVRLLISGAALILGALVSQISIWGVAAGILAFPLATYCEKFRPEIDEENDSAGGEDIC